MVLSESDARVERVEWVRLHGERPRSAGSNARLGVHGQSMPCDLVRITAGGLTGFGWSRISREQAESLIGLHVRDLFEPGARVREAHKAVEFPLLDWLGRLTGRPVYALVAGERTSPLTVPCYDTSLYFDDLHLSDDAAAVELLQAEAAEGLARGHRAFKMKIGRGARHMELAEGTRRDIALILGVRAAIGPDARLMVDANNGYNLNLTKHVLSETAAAGLYWIEEAFHEDPVLYEALKGWMAQSGLQVLIADGEGLAAPPLVEWAKKGLVDVIQYDIRQYGFSRWLQLGPELDAAGVRSAPHNYGSPFGNYASCHLAPAIAGFQMAEWDEAAVPGMDGSRYRIAAGRVHVPDLPGFGLHLDDGYFTRMVSESGWTLRER